MTYLYLIFSGFLSLNDPLCETPGNAGLKDQLLGLKWLKQNIVNFNGDPNNITLFGESAGAASVHYLMLSPLAKDLFHKAILMSGNVLCSWAMSTVNKMPFRLVKSLGFAADNASDKEILEFLQNVRAEELVKPYLLTKDENLEDSIFQFGPSVEAYETENCLIHRQPIELFEEAWGNHIPIMIGGTSFEGLLMFARAHIAPFLVNDLENNLDLLVPFDLRRKCSPEKQKQLGALIKKTHFGDKEINMSNILNYCEVSKTI